MAPFLQRIQLLGPGEAIVRATGQVDDGAMKNCISKKRWEGYGHCLSPLGPSKTRIRVASRKRIVPMGRWWGDVQVGRVRVSAWFEVFDCGDAFDVILGKPWLHAVRASHDYDEDRIHIRTEDSEAVICNDESEAREEEPETLDKVSLLQKTGYPATWGFAKGHCSEHTATGDPKKER
jgi:hypothetical protein